MAYKSNGNDDVVNLPRSEWQDWTGAEEALSKLAHIAGAQRHGEHDAKSDRTANTPAAPAQSSNESQTPVSSESRKPAKRRRVSRVIARYLTAVCLGIFGTLAWQAHGETAKQMAASLMLAAWQSHGEPAEQQAKQWFADVWKSHIEPVKQRVANWLPQPTWPERQRQRAALPGANGMSPADPRGTNAQDMQVLASDIDALRKSVDQISANQEQMARDIARLQGGQNARLKTPVLQHQVKPASAP